MTVTETYTITELLKSSAIKYNQTSLARLLNCNRGTLRKYMKDVNGDEHLVRCYNGRYQLMPVTAGIKAT